MPPPPYIWSNPVLVRLMVDHCGGDGVFFCFGVASEVLYQSLQPIRICLLASHMGVQVKAVPTGALRWCLHHSFHSWKLNSVWEMSVGYIRVAIKKPDSKAGNDRERDETCELQTMELMQPL